MKSGLKSMQLVKVNGSAYEIGLELGRLGRSAARDVLPRIGRFQEVVEQWGSSDRLRELEAAARQHFPEHMSTLEGIATGAKQPFDLIFAWNCRGDFPGGGDQSALAGCTDVMAIDGERVFMGHNEDDQSELDGHCWLVECKPTDGAPFTSFYSPGLLPGHTFGWNAAGLVQTINHIRTHDQSIGVPRHLLARAVLDCQTMDEAVSLIRSTPRAGGFHHNLGQFNQVPSAVSVEAPASGVSVRNLAVGVAQAHANHLVHDALEFVPQTVAPSSASRQARADALSKNGISSVNDALALLADGEDTALPIRRKGTSSTDPGFTLASATFEISESKVAWRVYRDTLCPPDLMGETRVEKP